MRDIGFSAVTEIQRGEDYIDVLFTYKKEVFVLEVKIVNESRKTEAQFYQAIVQAYGYAVSSNTKNLIVVRYPYDVRGILRPTDDITGRALDRRVQAMILTERWYEYDPQRNLRQILSTLKSKIDQNEGAVQSAEDTSRAVQEAIRALSRLLNKSLRDEKEIVELAGYLSNDYGLFLALSGQKNSRKTVRSQTIDLIAYILTNQILFYFIYSRRNSAKGLPQMQPITHPEELLRYFDAIRKIDFAPIFDIKVATRVPPVREIITHINDMVTSLLEALRVERVSDDLYGRLFGKSIPYETRDILASYYTKVAPARMLASLTIGGPFDKVWDPACGSGTLLVAAYDRKKTLYHIANSGLESDADLAALHQRFIQKEITGTDIMPFACHLASLNLATQNLAVPTDSTRVCYGNSLSIEELPTKWKEAYGDIYKELTRVSLAQPTISSFTPQIERDIKPKEILLEKVDSVLVNPPFTRVSKLPVKLRHQLAKASERRLFGAVRLPLWGNFLGLTNRILKDGRGKLGAIIPISMLRGRDTLRIRRHYLSNYTIEYIVRPERGTAFSEDSDYGDMIFVATKSKPQAGDRVKIVMLRVGGRFGLSSVDVDEIVRKITLSETTDDDDMWMYQVEQSRLLADADNLMPYVFTSNKVLQNTATKWTEEMRGSDKMRRLPREVTQNGYQFHPENVAANSLFTRNLSEARIRKSKQYFDKSQSAGTLTYYTRNGEVSQRSIQGSKLKKTLRTITSVRQMNITDLHDYVLSSEAKSRSRGVNLFVARRFRPNSPETFAIAFYSKDRFVPTEKIVAYDCSDRDARLLCLWFNSVFHLTQILQLSSQATYGYLEMKELDLQREYIPRVESLQSSDVEAALALFERLQARTLDSLVVQFGQALDYRLELDLILARILGLSVTERELSDAYRALASELQSMAPEGPVGSEA